MLHLHTRGARMKTRRKLFLLPALITGLGLILAGRVTAQTFTVLHTFTSASGPNGTNGDGANPSAGLILSNDVLYGTASAGGSSGAGTVFALNANGMGFTNLHSFTAPANDSFGFYTNIDGAYPLAGLLLSGGTLYGAANNGGTSGHGTVFA